jgi:transaldolase
MMKRLEDLTVKIFADGAEKAGMLEMYAKPYIKGFTTNPTLMHKVGLTDYRAFARDVVEAIPDRPISFEVFSDEFDVMERQARTIASWGENVWVKIPITNTRRASSIALIHRLSHDGIKINVTAVMTLPQVRCVVEAVAGGARSCISMFAGRIADTGRDPVPYMAQALDIMAAEPRAELVWASPRELLNIFQADAVGCHVITVTSDILQKLALINRDLDDFSLETVKMFYTDGQRVRFEL